MRLALRLVMLSLALVIGCVSLPDAPGPGLAKVRSWWQSICSSGDEALAVAQRTVDRWPLDAGAIPVEHDAGAEQ